MARSRLVVAALLAAAVVVSSAAARPAAPFSLSQLHPMSEPPGWIPLEPPSRTSTLWYPPFMKQQSGNSYSVTTVYRNPANGNTLVYLNAGPPTGPEKLSNWPSFRLQHLRDARETKVHEDGEATDVAFNGGMGSCVLDDYVTWNVPHHYREIACFVQGKKAASVLVAAALESAWPSYGAQLVRAVEAWQVN